MNKEKIIAANEKVAEIIKDLDAEEAISVIMSAAASFVHSAPMIVRPMVEKDMTIAFMQAMKVGILGEEGEYDGKLSCDGDCQNCDVDYEKDSKEEILMKMAKNTKNTC